MRNNLILGCLILIELCQKKATLLLILFFAYINSWQAIESHMAIYFLKFFPVLCSI